MNRFNTILTIASGIASVFALCLTFYWAGRRSGRAKAGPQRSVYSARAALEKYVRTILASSPADIDVVGYSVHALLDGLQPAVRRALEAGKRVRVLMLSARSAGLLEKSALERNHHGLDLQALRTRNAEQIERTCKRLRDLAADVCYQSNVSRVYLEVRAYDQFPVYRGAVTASGDTLLASYLIDPSRPGRELEHLCASRDPKLDEATRREVRAFGHWFAYLWEHRSRPFEIETVLFDLYDTLIVIPAEVRRAYRAQIADLIGITADKLDLHWEATREASNKGLIRTTEDRFDRICELAGKGGADLPRRLAGIEHDMLKERVEYCPNALETLKALRLRGYLIGVSSNCSVSALNAINGSGLSAHVDLLYLSCQVGEMKPSVAMYVRPVTLLGSRLSRSIFVGDGDNDELGGAKAAGLAAAVGVGLRITKLHAADVTIRDLAELVAVIPDLPTVRSAATARA